MTHPATFPQMHNSTVIGSNIQNANAKFTITPYKYSVNGTDRQNYAPAIQLATTSIGHYDSASWCHGDITLFAPLTEQITAIRARIKFRKSC